MGNHTPRNLISPVRTLSSQDRERINRFIADVRTCYARAEAHFASLAKHKSENDEMISSLTKERNRLAFNYCRRSGLDDLIRSYVERSREIVSLLGLNHRRGEPDFLSVMEWEYAFNSIINSILPPILPLLQRILVPLGYMTRKGRLTRDGPVILDYLSGLALIANSADDSAIQQGIAHIEAPGCCSTIPLSVRFSVFVRDGYRCVYCGHGASDGVKLELDHSVSVKDGGEDTEDNLVTACDACNRGKGAMSL